jgi:hypothetical protein
MVSIALATTEEVSAVIYCIFDETFRFFDASGHRYSTKSRARRSSMVLNQCFRLLLE